VIGSVGCACALLHDKYKVCVHPVPSCLASRAPSYSSDTHPSPLLSSEMINDGRLVVTSIIIALLFTCFQDCGSRPLPGEGSYLRDLWLPYLLEVPESAQHAYTEMPFQSGPESHFSYTASPQLHEYQPISSGHGLDHDYIMNVYHHPSSSNTVLDHHFNLPSEQPSSA
jgi:hypothetical protein